MANMSYCRFENTLRDLQDCYDTLQEMQDDPEDCEPLSVEEDHARKQLLGLCERIVNEFVEEEDSNEEE